MNDQIKQTNENISVLVVDDDEFIRNLLVRHLTNRGYRVFSAESGEDAILLVQKGCYDLALIDILLQGISGIELVDEMKKICPDIIMITMTGHPTMETALDAMKKGVHDYLIKPFKLEQLDEVLSKSFESQRIKRENQRLKSALAEAEEQIKQYEMMLGQPQTYRVHPIEDKSIIQNRGDAVYRFQSLKTQRSAMEDRLKKLALLREEGVISQDEYEQKQKQIESSGIESDE